jgi:hypothetical protein
MFYSFIPVASCSLLSSSLRDFPLLNSENYKQTVNVMGQCPEKCVSNFKKLSFVSNALESVHESALSHASCVMYFNSVTIFLLGL